MTFDASPARNAPTVTTASLVGSTSRATIVCNALTICAPTAIGSTVRCGCAPWPPLPLIRMSKRSAAAMHGPPRSSILPTGISAATCCPKTRSTVGSLQHAFLDHHARAAAAFFGWLEEQLDRAAELIPPVEQQTPDAQQHGGMRIVSASVHLAVDLRAVVDLVFFAGSAGRPCRHAPARPVSGPPIFVPLIRPGHAGNGDPGADVLDAHRFEPLGHQLGGFEFLESQLRMLVQMPPVGNDSRHDLVDIVLQITSRCDS